VLIDPDQDGVTQHAIGGGANRITVYFADDSIENQWLEVTVKSNLNTGLAQPDVHYWGNAIGETGLGQPGSTRVNATDRDGVVNNFSNSLNVPGVSNKFDINRDGSVNSTDRQLVINNFTSSLTDLPILNLPAMAALDSSFAIDIQDHLGGGIIASGNAEASPLVQLVNEDSQRSEVFAGRKARAISRAPLSIQDDHRADVFAGLADTSELGDDVDEETLDVLARGW
jgi:hypothetical protein